MRVAMNAAASVSASRASSPSSTRLPAHVAQERGLGVERALQYEHLAARPRRRRAMAARARSSASPPTVAVARCAGCRSRPRRATSRSSSALERRARDVAAAQERHVALGQWRRSAASSLPTSLPSTSAPTTRRSATTGVVTSSTWVPRTTTARCAPRPATPSRAEQRAGARVRARCVPTEATTSPVGVGDLEHVRVLERLEIAAPRPRRWRGTADRPPCGAASAPRRTADRAR